MGDRPGAIFAIRLLSDEGIVSIVRVGSALASDVGRLGEDLPRFMREVMRNAMSRIALWGGLGFACLVGWGASAHGQGPLGSGTSVGPRALSSPGDHFRGAGSCSAVACHGGVSPSGHSSILKNEHTTWIADDPHALAYETLHGERSARIARKLAGRSGKVIPAHQDERCLACHSTPRPAAELRRTEWMNRDGVSCEACHGASEKWLGPHTTEGWSSLGAEIKERDYGFRPTRDLARRAGLCAECHVGDRKGGAGAEVAIIKDVNHDLIAAGHPRLNFELAAYLDNLPPHWREKGRNAAPDFPALAWSVGQVATTKAGLELLRGRVGDARAPWPEFSEYGCFSCHHELADEPWRRNRAEGLAGSPHWGSWYLPMNGALAQEEQSAGRDPNGDWKAFETAIQQLLNEMSRPIPKSGKVRELVGSALQPLDRRLDSVASRSFSAADAERVVNAFHDPRSWSKVESWDQAAQRYLGIVPFRQVWVALAPDRRADQDALGRELDALRKRLMFGETLDSPQRGFAPASLRGSP